MKRSRVIRRLSLLAVLALVFSSEIASAQSIPTDAQPTCILKNKDFASFFEGGKVMLNGVIKPPNSVKFDDTVDCNFYRWSEQMFLWLTSQAPQQSSGRKGRQIFESPEFFDISALQSGERTFIRHTSEFTSMLGVRGAQAGPAGLPVLFDKNGRLLQVAPVQTGNNGLPLIRNRIGDLVEIAGATIGSDKKPIFRDAAGGIIQYELKQGDRQLRPIESDRIITVYNFIIAGQSYLIDSDGNVIDAEVGQASTNGVQLAQNGSLVYYLTMVNDVYAFFKTAVVKNRIKPGNQFPTTKEELNEIETFARAHGTTFLHPQVLAVEVKSAWVEADRLPDKDKANYITMTATVPTFNRDKDDAKWSPNSPAETELALVGMHVVGSVAGHPEMIWATFEHFGNAPNATYMYYSISGRKPKTVLQNMEGTWLFAENKAAAPFNVAHQQLVGAEICVTSMRLGVCGMNGKISPSNTLRLKAWGDAWNAPPSPQVSAKTDSNTAIISINNSIRRMMPDGDVRKNYFMIGATWTHLGQAPVADGHTDRGARQLLNTTMETFNQAPDNTTPSSITCFTCHFSNQTSVSSHLSYPEATVSDALAAGRRTKRRSAPCLLRTRHRLLRWPKGSFWEGFRMTAPSRTMPRAPGAVVRKPPRKESAGSGAPGSAGTMGIWLGATGAAGVGGSRARSVEEGQSGR